MSIFFAKCRNSSFAPPPSRTLGSYADSWRIHRRHPQPDAARSVEPQFEACVGLHLLPASQQQYTRIGGRERVQAGQGFKLRRYGKDPEYPRASQRVEAGVGGSSRAGALRRNATRDAAGQQGAACGNPRAEAGVPRSSRTRMPPQIALRDAGTPRPSSPDLWTRLRGHLNSQLELQSLRCFQCLGAPAFLARLVRYLPLREINGSWAF